MELKNKIAVVTGAGKGLGKAISTSLVNKGALVYGLARTETDLIALHTTLGSHFVPVPLDISDREQVMGWVAETFSGMRPPQILINNAGAGYFAKIDALSWEQWDEMIGTNLNGLFYMTTGLVPLMKKQKETCHIINIGSILGKTTRQEAAVYCLTKYGVQGFSSALFKELRSHNIRVSCLNPGSISTRFFEDSGILPNDGMIAPQALADLAIYVLETPDTLLIDELTIRPMSPK